jgi:hypothetical protein
MVFNAVYKCFQTVEVKVQVGDLPAQLRAERRDSVGGVVSETGQE